MTSGQLVRYDSMCRAIAEAHAVDEVKDIRDKSLALEAYFRQAKNTDAERKACEIRLRAERKAGELLHRMDKAKGARGNPGGRGAPIVQSYDGTTQTLSDLGISKKQSAKWQQLASVPEADFEAALAAREKPSTTSIVNGHRKPERQMDPRALWLWGRLRDFERDILGLDQADLISEMTEAMQADVSRLAPLVSEWLGEIA